MRTVRELDQSAWARNLGLRESTRPACFCGLTRKQICRHYKHETEITPLHELCAKWRYALLDHGQLYNRDGKPALLIAHTYADRRGIREGLPAVLNALPSLNVWVGSRNGRLSFYNPGECRPIIYKLEPRASELEQERIDRILHESHQRERAWARANTCKHCGIERCIHGPR